MKRTIITALVFLLAISCATNTGEEYQFNSDATYLILHPEGETISESVGTLHDYIGQGNYVLVDFWSTGCRPCQPEIPKLIDLYEKYKQYGLIVLGVPFDKDSERLKIFIQKHGITYDQVVDSSKIIRASFNVNAIPYMILLGPDGEIIGESMRAESLERTIWKNLIKKKKVKR